MHYQHRILAAVGVVFALYTPCAAGETFFDDFESYEVGSDLHGQGGWKGWDNESQYGAPVSAEYSSSGENSLKIDGDADLVHEVSAANGKWVVRAMQYIPRGATGESWFILMNQYEDGKNDPAEWWSLELNFDLHAGTVADANRGGEVSLVRDRWTEVRVEVDLTENVQRAYYNDELIVTGEWYGSKGAIAAIDLFANNASPVYYDDIRVVPEPSSFGILLFGGMLLLPGMRNRA